jgi:hypothetical protein
MDLVSNAGLTLSSRNSRRVVIMCLVTCIDAALLTLKGPGCGLGDWGSIPDRGNRKKIVPRLGTSGAMPPLKLDYIACTEGI